MTKMTREEAERMLSKYDGNNALAAVSHGVGANEARHLARNTREELIKVLMGSAATSPDEYARGYDNGFAEGKLRGRAEILADTAADRVAAIDSPEAEVGNSKPPRPCDDEDLAKGLRKAISEARTPPFFDRLESRMGPNGIDSIVLQITEGSTVLDDLVDRHINAAKQALSVEAAK
jgi:hypothetical protein